MESNSVRVSLTAASCHDARRPPGCFHRPPDCGYRMPMLLLLVRHGNTSMTGTRLTGRLPGVHLSEEGVRQAKDAAERLANLPVKAVYSSPLERCHETAVPIAERHRLEVQTVDNLAEVAYGEWQGRPFTQLYRLKAWSELQAHPADFRFPGGETIREVFFNDTATTE